MSESAGGYHGPKSGSAGIDYDRTRLAPVVHVSGIRKSYGRAYVCMGGGRHSDDIAAWPTAEVSFMSPEFATKIVHGVGAGEAGFDEKFAQIQKGSDVWGLASVYAAQAVIRPATTPPEPTAAIKA